MNGAVLLQRPHPVEADTGLLLHGRNLSAPDVGRMLMGQFPNELGTIPTAVLAILDAGPERVRAMYIGSGASETPDETGVKILESIYIKDLMVNQLDAIICRHDLIRTHPNRQDGTIPQDQRWSVVTDDVPYPFARIVDTVVVEPPHRGEPEMALPIDLCLASLVRDFYSLTPEARCILALHMRRFMNDPENTEGTPLESQVGVAGVVLAITEEIWSTHPKNPLASRRDKTE